MASLDFTIRRGYNYYGSDLNRSFITARLDEMKSTPGWTGPGRETPGSTSPQSFHFYSSSEMDRVKLVFILTVMPGAYFKEEDFANNLRQYGNNITNVRYRNLTHDSGMITSDGYVDEEEVFGAPRSATMREIEIEFDPSMPSYYRDSNENYFIEAPVNGGLHHLNDTENKVFVTTEFGGSGVDIHGETIKLKVRANDPSEELYNIELYRSHHKNRGYKNSPYRFQSRNFVLPLKKLSDGTYEAEFKVSNPVMHPGDEFMYSISKVNQTKLILLKRENVKTADFTYKIGGKVNTVSISEDGTRVPLIIGATMTTEKEPSSDYFYRLTKYNKNDPIDRHDKIIINISNMRNDGILDSLKIIEDIKEIYTSQYKLSLPILAVKYTNKTSQSAIKKFEESTFLSQGYKKWTSQYIDETTYKVYTSKIKNGAMGIPFTKLVDIHVEDTSYIEPYTRGIDISFEEEKKQIGKIDKLNFVISPKLDGLVRPVIYLTYEVIGRNITNTNPYTKQQVIQHPDKRFDNPLYFSIVEDFPQDKQAEAIYLVREQRPVLGGDK